MPTIRANFQDANDFVIGKVYALESDTIRELYSAYSSAYQEMLAAMSSTWNVNNLKQTWSAGDIQARQQLLQQISTIMNRLDAQATRTLFNRLGDAYRTGFYGAAYTIDSMMPASARIPLLPTDAIAAQVLSPYLGQTWLDRYRDNRVEFELRIKRALTQSQIQGESMADAQRRIRDELGIVTDRRLAVDRQAHRRNFNRTMMIARSEIIRASNNASVAVYQANDDVLRGWEFKATNDERTCDICGPLDGRMFDFNNNPIDGKGGVSETLPPPVHVNCRCASMPALFDKVLEDRIVGKRVTFNEWAQSRGITQNMYGQAYDLRGKSAPQTKGA